MQVLPFKRILFTRWLGTWNMAGEGDRIILCASRNFILCITSCKYINQRLHYRNLSLVYLFALEILTIWKYYQFGLNMMICMHILQWSISHGRETDIKRIQTQMQNVHNFFFLDYEFEELIWFWVGRWICICFSVFQWFLVANHLLKTTNHLH